jgi:hypothetical protein
MPFLNTFPATRGGGMMGDEDPMPSHWCLFAVIFRKIGRNPGIYKLKFMLFDGFKTFSGYLISVFLR